MKKVTGEFVQPCFVDGFRFVWPYGDIGRENVAMIVEYCYKEGIVYFEVWAQVDSYPLRACIMSDETICENDEGTIIACIMRIINLDKECRESVLAFIDWVTEEE